MLANAAPILAAQTLTLWGDGRYGQTNPPANLGNVRQVAGGGFHVVALREDGTVVAWGSNSYGATNVPANLFGVVSISSGAWHSLALRSNGRVYGWGQDQWDQASPPLLSDAVMIDAYGTSSVALRRNGTMVPWGRFATNLTPGLTNLIAATAAGLALKPDGTLMRWRDPEALAVSLTNVVDIAGHSLALLADGTVAAWGAANDPVTLVPEGLTNVVAIAAGFEHRAALRSDGTVVVWGENQYGETNVPPGLTQVTSIAGTGYGVQVLGETGSPYVIPQLADRVVASTDRVVFNARVTGGWPLRFQWRLDGTDLPGATNRWLILDDARPSDSGTYSLRVTNPWGSSVGATANLVVHPIGFSEHPLSQVVRFGSNVVLSASAYGSTGITYQWLFNGVPIPGATSSTLELTNVKFEQSGTYALRASGLYGEGTSLGAELEVRMLEMWGVESPITQVPPGLGAVSSVDVGGAHVLVLRSDGSVAAWGFEVDQPEVQIPPGLEEVVAVAAGYQHSLALKSDGTVVGWGENAGGQLALTNSLPPVVAIAAGAPASKFSVALTEEGGVVTSGQVSHSYYVDPIEPVTAGLSNQVAIAAGMSHILALGMDGTVTARGYSEYGQTNVPPDLTNVIDIAAGGLHSLALRANGTVVAWGYNASGQTNVPLGLSNVIAVAASSGASAALRQDGTVINWGADSGQYPSPVALTNVVAVAGKAGAFGAIGPAGPPRLLPRLARRSFGVGDTARVRCLATGDLPLHYQWRRNGIDIPGATNALLTIANVQMADTGEYSLSVSNAWGTSVGAVTQIGVDPVRINPQPVGQTLYPGQSTTLSVAAQANEPIQYQWRFNGEDIPGANTAELELTGLAPAQSGNYSVRVSSPEGSTVSQEVWLEVQTVIAWGPNHFGQTNVPPGLGEILAIGSSEGNRNLLVDRNGQVIHLGYLPDLPTGLSNVVDIAVAREHSVALLADGTVRGWGAYPGGGWGSNPEGEPWNAANTPAGLSNVIKVVSAIRHDLALRSDGTVVGWGDISPRLQQILATTSNVVDIAARPNSSLLLRADGTLLHLAGESKTEVPGEPSLVAIAADDQLAQGLHADGRVAQHIEQGVFPGGGVDDIVAISPGLMLNRTGTVIDASIWPDWDPPTGLPPASAIAGRGLALLAHGPPRIRPMTRVRTTGTTGTTFFRVDATGVFPLSVQWLHNGQEIPGATNRVLAVTDAQLSHSGAYSVRVSNSFGTTTEPAGQLTVQPLIALVGPETQWVYPGGDAVLQANVLGVGPQAYQWYFEGAPLPGQTNATLELPAMRIDQAGDYLVEVTNPLGSTMSSPALVDVRTIFVWGAGLNAVTNVPARLGRIVDLAVAHEDILALRDDGTVVGWGSQVHPVPPSLSNVRDIAAGFSHFLAAHADGSVTAWGFNSHGETTVPAGLTDVVAVDAGPDHSLALREDGTVTAWGANNHGQSTVPPDLDNVVGIAAGDAFSIAIQSDGTMVAWGRNFYPYTDSGGPVYVPPEATNIVQVTASGHVYALRSDGAFLAWGSLNNPGWEYAPQPDFVPIVVEAGGFGGTALEAGGRFDSWGYLLAESFATRRTASPGEFRARLVSTGPSMAAAVLTDISQGKIMATAFGSTLDLKWFGADGLRLQRSPGLGSNTDWEDVPGTLGESHWSEPAPGDSGFFRLFKPVTVH